MKFLFLIALLFFSRANASLELNCLPVSIVNSNAENAERKLLSGKDIKENALKILKEDHEYKVATRSNAIVSKLKSGEYVYYTSEGITVKFHPASKEYFEFVHMGLGTFLYFGKCL